MDKNKDYKKIEAEDSTRYGEFVSSFFSWIPIEKQKAKAEELNNIEKDKNKKF